MDLVSIIIPVYNVRNYLKKCITSVLNQTYENVEIILVDDGSTDGSSQLCDKYVVEDNVRVFHKKNGGLSDARNYGIKKSQGNFICFLDSDDYVSTNFICELVQASKKNDADLVLCDYFKVNLRGEVINENRRGLKNETWDKTDFWKHYFSDNVVACVVSWNKLYRRELFSNIEYRRGKVHEDEFIIKKIIDNSKKISIIGEKLYYYVERTESIMHRENCKGKIDLCEAYFERIEGFLNNKEYELAYLTLNNILIKLAELHTSNKKSVYRKKIKYFNALSKKKIKKLVFLKNPSLKMSIKLLLFFMSKRLFLLIINKKRVRLLSKLSG